MKKVLIAVAAMLVVAGGVVAASDQVCAACQNRCAPGSCQTANCGCKPCK